MRPARIPRGVFRTSSFPSNARATRRGSRLKNSALNQTTPLRTFIPLSLSLVIPREARDLQFAARCRFLASLGMTTAKGVACALSLGRTLQISQHFVRVPFRLHIIENVLDLAVGTNDESRPRDPFHFLAIHVLLFDHAEKVRNFLLWIGQQRERQTELVLKLLLRGRCVGGYSKQHHAGLLDRRIAVAEAARFLGASRRVGLGIEIKHHRFAAKIF